MTYVSVRSYTVYRGEKVLFQGSLILVRLDSLDMYTLHEVNTKLIVDSNYTVYKT
jgi:hypothetical protein